VSTATLVTDRRAGGWRELALGAVLCALAAAAVAGAAAGGVVLLGLGGELRRSLGFGFAGVERSPTEAARIALHNAKFALGILACTLAAPQLPRRARPLLDLALATLLVVNAGTVGVALGAYGDRAFFALAAHLPLEFAALSLVGGAYLTALHAPPRLRTLTGVVAACGALLCAAAAAETYAQLGAAP
jgi:hypothetical protein